MTVVNKKSVAELAEAILTKTNGGYELAPIDAKLVELACEENGGLETRYYMRLCELCEKISTNTYKQPWLQGINNLLIDQAGFVLYKGHVVERFELKYAYDNSSHAELKQLVENCEYLEARGYELNVTNTWYIDEIKESENKGERWTGPVSIDEQDDEMEY